jgi:hypothetical protein
MHGRRNQSPKKLAVDVGQPTMFDWNGWRILARRTSIIAILSLTYVALGSVIWGAYHKFGDRPLPIEAPLIAADATPVKLVPRLQPRDPIASAPAIGDRPAKATSPQRERLVAAAGPPSAPIQLPGGSRAAPPTTLAQAEPTEPAAPVANPSANAGAAPAQLAKTELALVKAVSPKAAEPAASPAPSAEEGGRPPTSGGCPNLPSSRSTPSRWRPRARGRTQATSRRRSTPP